ncbi:protein DETOXIFICATION 45, chloroplastic-like isoform X2 [Magnolia sinica]|uniref:protein DETOXIFICATION 45, chloroplastic-like isoform X2 n=1 Tax=Magnolia sinica TaxID=86752 RepID=UPI0026586E74|nr:protein DETOXIFICATION 45, chloroplastic-like isoform X2 [Magnolia sinica]
MKVTQLRGPLPNGLTASRHEEKPMKKMIRSSASGCSVEIHNLMIMDNEVSAPNIVKPLYLAGGHNKPFFSPVMAYRKRIFSVVNSQSRSDYSAGTYDEGSFTGKKGDRLGSFMEGIFELMGIPTTGSGSRSVDNELVILALPAIIGQAVEPFSQLMETAFIGRLGPLELASAGVSVSIFNIISKLFNIPLLSVTTSFVAEDIAKNAHRDSVLDRDPQEENGVGKPFFEASPERMQLPSVSTALFLASGIGILEAAGLYLGAGMFLNMMGLPLASPMRIPAQRFLSLRALGAPAVVLSLAIQGIFRGFKDTRTPLLCLGVGNISAVFLLPLFMYSFRLGIIGAAIATITSQYIVTLLLIWFLNKRAVLLPPKIEDLQFDGYMKSGGLLLGRTLAVQMTLFLGTSMAAPQGPIAMAGHQICLQVWLPASLLSDALGAAGQALIASSFSKSDYKKVREITYSVLKTGAFTGVFLAIILGTWYGSIAELFTKDVEVLGIVRSGFLFVCATQPINALAFVFDGLHYGVSDFSYAAFSSMVVGVMSSAFLVYAPSVFGLPGVWFGLTLFMLLRMVAGLVRLGVKTGPWWFLHNVPETEVATVD